MATGDPSDDSAAWGITSRPHVDVFITGTNQFSLAALEQQWKVSSLSSILSQFADIIIHTEEDTNGQFDGFTSKVYLRVFNQNDKDDIHSAWVYVTSTLFQGNDLNIFLVENCHFKHDAHNREPPPGYAWPQNVRYLSISTKIADTTDTTSVLFNTAILHPLLEELSLEDFKQISYAACTAGNIDILQAYISKGHTPEPMKWMELTLKSIHSKSCTDNYVSDLLEVSLFIYNIDTVGLMEYLHTQWEVSPRGVLMVLCKISNPFNKWTEHLMLDKLNLSKLIPSSIADTAFTHISLRGNNLTTVPEELLQLQSLEHLNLSHNRLEKLPSLLRWNCPKLGELNLSHNSLVDPQKGIIRRSLERRHSTSDTTYSIPQQKILQLTDHNMYSCLHSLIIVDLSHNPRLTQVPEWVCVIPHLICLNLRGIPHLRELPKSLANFRDLTVIQVDSENMTYPPAKVCRRGSQAIVTYLKSLLRGSSNYRRMNIMILGRGKSGKSSLFRNLLGQKGDKLGESTGIGSYDYRGETRDRTVHKVTYHLMDMSTEAINLSIYQCFLKCRCVYLCLWDISTGKEGLKSLSSIIRNIHLRVPNSQVVLIATHCDTNPEVTLTEVLTWEREVFNVEEPQSLHDQSYSSSHGLPRLYQPLLIDVQNKDHVEVLKSHIHLLAGDMTVHNSEEKLIEEVVPRSCTLLQSHIESKVKQRVNVIRYGELIDSFRSLHHRSGDTSDDNNEFDLACKYLHESGTMYHHHSDKGTPNNDLFFLNFQWLSDMLTILVTVCSNTISTIYTDSTLKSVLASYGLPSYLEQPLISLMTKYDLIIPINLDKTSFLMPSYLPLSPTYLPCDLTSDRVLICKVSFQYLPDNLFFHLISEVLSNLNQTGAQLVTNGVAADKARSTSDAVSSPKRIHEYKLGRGGYMKQNKDFKQRENAFKKVQLLSYVKPINATLQDSLRMKLDSLSVKFLHKLPQFIYNIQQIWTCTYQFSRCSISRKGLHVEFLDGTLGWLEVSGNDVTVATEGDDLCRSKVFEFFLSSLQIVCQKQYVNLKQTLSYVRDIADKPLGLSLENVISQRRVHSEFNIFSNIEHSCILSPLEVSVDSLCVVFPSSPFGSLEDHLELCPNGIDDRISHILLYQIADGMKYLHSLNIIHTDIKPSNVLVWSLNQQEVSVKLTGCALSRYDGLKSNDELYMAPELLTSTSKESYSEKVDVFSFGVLLYNVVTGKEYIPNLYNKDGTAERKSLFTRLSIIATAIEKRRLQGKGGELASKVLEKGIHPGARQGHITMCISTCMQRLMEDCLAGDPKRRPTAEGITGCLLVCVGPSTQDKYILQDNCRISSTALLPSGDIVAWETNQNISRIITLAPNTFASQLASLPIDSCRHVAVSGSALFCTSSSKRVHSFTLPSYTNMITAKNELPSLSSCVLASDDGKRLVVFMENGKVALYTSEGEESVLNNPPVINKPFDHPDKRKSMVTCGVLFDNVIICNGGRYLVGITYKLQQLFYKLLGAVLIGITGSCGKHLWVWFDNSGEVAICDGSNGEKIDKIEMKFLLEDSIGESRASTVFVSMVMSTPKGMWVGTSAGHLFGFHYETFELLVAMHQHVAIDTALCSSEGNMLLVFGQWSCGESDDKDRVSGFSIWYLHY